MTVATHYMRDDTHTINTVNDYQLGPSNTATGSSYTAFKSSPNNGYHDTYIDVRILNDSGSFYSTIGTGVCFDSFTSNGYHIENATWACPETALADTDAVGIKGWSEIEGLFASRDFLTVRAEDFASACSQLDAATWTWHMHGNRYFSSGRYGQNLHGDATYDTHILNFEYSGGAAGGLPSLALMGVGM